MKAKKGVFSVAFTRVVTVPVVGGVVVVVVVLERPGSQISNTQKFLSVIGADSAPSIFRNGKFLERIANLDLRQNSVPLAAP